MRNKTAQARRYAKQLARSRWFEYCETFDQHTSTRKLWQTHRTMSGKHKTQNSALNIQMALDLTPEEFEVAAAEAFFPQPAVPADPRTYEPRKPASDLGAEAPFTLQELTLALDAANVRSAPGGDGITWQMLLNLDEPEKLLLLDELNEIWRTGSIPAEWKHSIIYPIPKPGKKPNSIKNLRPIALTSTLCKLLERMVLTRLTYHLEEENPAFFDPAQTGFRPGLCTQDSLLLLRQLVGGGRRGLLKVPGILLAVDLQKAFDTVAHTAILTALDGAGVGTRIMNFVRSFLVARTFEVKSGSGHPRTFSNARGVPQGAILSSPL